MPIKEYKEKFNVALTKCQSSRERYSGENNPAYQHGGKYSPWSEKFIKGTKNIESAKKKARDTVKNNDSYPMKLDYWIRKTNGDLIEAERLHKELISRAAFTLENCIEKHGEFEGERIYRDRQIRWQNTLSSKPIEEIQRINKSKVSGGYFISKAEKEIQEKLESFGFFVETQFTLKLENNKSFIYDLKIGNKIIEYNGDFWHCNPKIYNKDFLNVRTKRTAYETWEKDKIKLQRLTKEGFDYLVIWENEYKENKQKVIQECLNFLTK